MRTAEVVQINIHGALLSDIQIGAFRNPTWNLQLAQSYIFTSSGSAASEAGSVELLEALVDACLPGSSPNRLMAIATFGHGKSHFAVAAANFFGQEIGSEAYDSVLTSLSHSVDEAQLEKFKTFRKFRDPFLVLLLKGDQPADLPSMFARALVEALESHPDTSAVRPPFWFEGAERFLDRIAVSDQPRAEQLLARHHLDIPALRAKLKSSDDTVYSVYRELFHELTGNYPQDLSGTNLADLIKWATDELCNPTTGTFGGIIVLFDEFSSFVHMYSAGVSGRHPSPLQDLLNGIQERREKVVFLALGQVDPREIARSNAGANLQSVLKELSRIERWLPLKSVLEEVLDSYLKQMEWEQLPEGNPVRIGVKQAVEATWSLFRNRYEHQLHWTQNQLLDRVGWGCFPLHPLTTALFSTIDYSAAGNPRSVLQFVFDAVGARSEQPIWANGRVNWVLPHELVDFFKEMLDPRAWDDYEDTLRMASGDITEHQALVLKSLLLLAAARVPTQQAGYSRVAALITGLDVGDVEAALEGLRRRALIRQDHETKGFGFWRAGRSAQLVGKLVAEKLRHLPKSDDATITSAFSALRNTAKPSRVGVNTALGHREDWAAMEIVISVQSLMAKATLETLGKQLTVFPKETSSPERGMVVWAIPSNEADVDWSREELARTLDSAFGDDELPVVLMRQMQTVPQLLDLIQHVAVLKQLSFSEIREVGEDQYREVLQTSLTSLEAMWRKVQAAGDPVVPRAFRGSVATAGAQTPARVLEVLYNQAYRSGPGEFFPIYKATATKFANAVTAIARALLEDAIGSRESTLADTNKVTSEIITKILKQRWKVIGNRGELQAPPDNGSSVGPAWQLLSATFPPGSERTSLGDVLLTLLNPPYGFDARSLTLLFSSWYGYHRSDLSFMMEGLPKQVTELLAKGTSSTSSANEFVAQLARGTITRHKVEWEQIDEILARIEDPSGLLEQSAARQDLAHLTQAVNSPEVDPPRQKRLASASVRLQKSLTSAESYDQQAERLLGLAQPSSQSSVSDLVSALNDVAKLPELTLVGSLHPSQLEINKIVKSALDVSVDRTCRLNEILPELSKYALHKKILDAQMLLLRKYPDLVLRVQEAQQKLEKNRTKLQLQAQAQQHDLTLRAEMQGMSLGSDVGLVTLRHYLDRLSKMEPSSQLSRDAVASKQEQILKAISNLEDRTRDLNLRLDEADSRVKVGQIRDELIGLSGLLEGSSLQSELDEARRRSDAHLAFFDQFDSMTGVNPTSREQVQTMIFNLEQLGSEWKYIGVQVENLVGREVERISRYVHEQEHEASVWLDGLVAELALNRDPWTLNEQANNEPPFLSPSECERLDQLRCTVRERIDHDAARQIEVLFAGIADIEARHSIVRELWKQVFGSVPAIVEH